MLLSLLLPLAFAAPASVDGVPLDVAQGIWQIEMFRLPPAALKAWLDDADPAIRARATRALGRLRDGDRGPELLKLVVGDVDTHVRTEAAFALGQTPGTARTIADRWGKETDPGVREVLAVALGKQGGPEAVPLLVEALDTPQAAAAAEGLGRLAMRKVEGAAAEPVARALLDHVGWALTPSHGRAAWALARLGMTTASPDTVARLRALALGDSDAEVRAWAVRAWAGVAGPPDRAATLGSLAADHAPGVRIAAARALTKGCTAENVPVAARLAGDAEDAVRIEGIAALGGCPADAVAATLRPLLGDTDPLVRATALRAAVAAKALGGPVDPFLAPDQPLAVRIVAVESLKDPDRLVKLALTSPEAQLRSAAAGAVLAAEAPRVPDVVALIAADDPLVAQGAADQLREKPDPTAEKALVDRLGRGDLGPAEATTLVKALAAVYATGTIAKPVPGAAKTLKPFLGLPGLEEEATRIAAVLQVAPPDTDHPTRRLPPLAEVLAIRSARILTEEGEIRVTLDPEEAPYTVWNFAHLAEEGYFDGVVFHRVVPDFVIQAGDPRGDGWGGPGYEIPDEINPLPYDTGALGMALSGPDTGGSQWFITLSPQPHLEGTYTVFGHVSYGMRNAEAIRQGDRITHIVIERVARPGS